MQKDVIREMVAENQKFPEIQNRLQKEFGEQALKRSSIYEVMREQKFPSSPKKDSSTHKRQYDEELLIIIQQEIDKEEFFSVRSLAQKLKCQPSLIHRYLHERLNLVFKKTKLVPHFLSSTQKIDRVEGSNQLFELLKKSKHNSYRNIITGDQSLF